MHLHALILGMLFLQSLVMCGYVGGLLVLVVWLVTVFLAVVFHSDLILV